MKRTILLLLFIPCACAVPAGDSGGGVAERDSAGVRIVESTSPVWKAGDGWVIDSVPLASIGEVSGDSAYMLFRVTGARRLSDGRIVVASAGTRQLRFYDVSGKFIRAVGRDGSGPGEFRTLGRLDVSTGDSILIYDSQAGRISVFDSSGKYVRTFSLETKTTPAINVRALGVFRDGTVLGNALRTFRMNQNLKPGAMRDTSSYFRLSAEGVILDTVGRFAAAETFVSMGADWVSIGALPFSHTPTAVPLKNEFLFGNGESWSIDVYSQKGERVRSLRRLLANHAVTPADIELYKQKQLESIRDPDQRVDRGKSLAEIPYPDAFPAYSAIRVDSDGNIWANESVRPGEDEGRWVVFDQEGRWLGIVTTPAGFTIYEIGADFILGRTTDELETERVVMYRLAKRRG